MALGDRDDESEIRLDELPLSLVEHMLCLANARRSFPEDPPWNSGALLERAEHADPLGIVGHPLDRIELRMQMPELQHDLVHDGGTDRQVTNDRFHCRLEALDVVPRSRTAGGH